MNKKRLKYTTLIIGIAMVVVILLAALVPLYAALQSYNVTRKDDKIAKEIQTQCPALYTDYEFAKNSGIPQLSGLTASALQTAFFVDGEWTCQDYQSFSQNFEVTSEEQ